MNKQFDPQTVNQVIENLSKAQKLPTTRKARSPRGPSEIQKTLDALLPAVQTQLAAGMSKKQIYSEVVRGGISVSGGTWAKWLKRNGLVRKPKTKVAS